MSVAKSASLGVLLGKSRLYYKDKLEPVAKEGDSSLA